MAPPGVGVFGQVRASHSSVEDRLMPKKENGSFSRNSAVGRRHAGANHGGVHVRFSTQSGRRTHLCVECPCEGTMKAFEDFVGHRRGTASCRTSNVPKRKSTCLWVTTSWCDITHVGPPNSACYGTDRGYGAPLLSGRRGIA